MNVTVSELNEMNRIRGILNNEIDTTSNILETDHIANGDTPLLSTIPNKKDINQMATFLKIMEGEMPVIIKESHNNDIMREALNTVKTPKGMRIGLWEMVKTTCTGVLGKPEAYYDILNLKTGKAELSELFNYTAAITIVKLFNEGLTVHDTKIIKIQELDGEYQRLRLKAMQEKYKWHSVKGTDTEWRQDLYEAKFDATKYRALFIKEQIKTLSLS